MNPVRPLSGCRPSSRLLKNVYFVRYAHAFGRSVVFIFSSLAALFRFAHPWLKAMGYQVVP